MSPEDLAVLKSLAIRPSLSIAPGLQRAVARLQGAGYISHGPSGWMATAKGCEWVEAREPTLASVPKPQRATLLGAPG